MFGLRIKNNFLLLIIQISFLTEGNTVPVLPFLYLAYESFGLVQNSGCPSMEEGSSWWFPKNLRFRTYRGTFLGWARNTDTFAVFCADHLCRHCHFTTFCAGFWARQGCIGWHGNVYFFGGKNIAKRFWKKISWFKYLLPPFFFLGCRVWSDGLIKPLEFFSKFTAISIIFISGKPEKPFCLSDWGWYMRFSRSLWK